MSSVGSAVAQRLNRDNEVASHFNERRRGEGGDEGTVAEQQEHYYVCLTRPTHMHVKYCKSFDVSDDLITCEFR